MDEERIDRSAATSCESAWEEAGRAGFDLDLIEDSLGLSPSERIRLHTLALVTALKLRRAMKERDHASAFTAGEPSRK
jgi:hypothetical protein